jgi:catechol 2,3-dioxygenase-like lactoylglutathione lyase family enzyme
MIAALESSTLAASDLPAAIAAYEALLSRRAASPTSDRGSFQMANGSLQLPPPTQRAGLTQVTFAVADLDAAQILLARRRLPTRRVAAHDWSAGDALLARPDDRRAFSIALVARNAATQAMSPLLNAHAASVAIALDHIVVRTPNPDRAIALFAGRLGLDLRLDQSNPDWGVRLMVFRCGDLIIEAAHDRTAGIGGGADRLWGLSWRVGDIRRAHTRLGAAGLQVSHVTRWSPVRDRGVHGTRGIRWRANACHRTNERSGRARRKGRPSGLKANRLVGATIDANDALGSQLSLDQRGARTCRSDP